MELDVDPGAAVGLTPEIQLALFRIVQDCARGLASGGALHILAGVISNETGVTVAVSGEPAGSDPAESLFWAMVEERTARHRGQARLLPDASRTRIEVTLPVWNSTWPVEH